MTRGGLLGMAAWLGRTFGPARARRVGAKWRERLDAEMAADLAVMAGMDGPDTDEDGRCLPALDLARRAGARDLARAILARAEITDMDLDEAMGALRHEQADADDGVVAGWDGAGAG